jgi:hypothetical protein
VFYSVLTIWQFTWNADQEANKMIIQIPLVC